MQFASIQNGQGVTVPAVVCADGSFRDIERVLVAYQARTGKQDLVLSGSPFLFARDGAAFADLFNAVTEYLAKDTDLAEFDYPVGTTVRCPFPRPNRILAIGRNYGEHAKELGNAIPEEPIVFMKASTCVIGPGEAIRVPEWVGRVDYEGELLVVIGEGGKDIPEADALKHVCAYTIFNDVTARERQRAAQEKRQPWFLAKSLDTFGPLGPYLVTADEIPDPHALQLTLSVNGEIKQNDTTGTMINSIPALIAYLSHWLALEPGDVIATGTPAGVGAIRPGDRVDITITGLGTLSNPVTV